MSNTAEIKNLPFRVKDCALITRMAGVTSAVNLRELRERFLSCPDASLFHHFSETLVRPSFDDPEFRNDFAVWSARTLRDRILAERLGILNPYRCDSIEQLREKVTDVLDERLSELPYVPSVHKGDEFIFMQATTVVFETDLTIMFPIELVKALPQMTTSSIYYHFVEARRRTPGKIDDFTAWLSEFGEGQTKVIESLRSLDFYYLTLTELKNALIKAVQPFNFGGQFGK